MKKDKYKEISIATNILLDVQALQIIKPKLLRWHFEFDNSKELKDIRVENYEYNLKIKMPVAV